MSEEDDTQTGVSIHTGFPNPAADKSLQTLDFNKLLVRHPASTFMFRIQGNDWAESGVFDGDIAVIDRTLDPRKNDVVLWWHESDGRFAVSNYATMPPEASCWGVVTASIHQFRKPTSQPK